MLDLYRISSYYQNSAQMNDRTLQQTGQPEPAVSIKIMNWSEPANFKSWVKRMFAPQALALMLLISLGFITELRFDWAEHLVGGYLVSTNSFRPRSGADRTDQGCLSVADSRPGERRERAGTRGGSIDAGEGAEPAIHGPARCRCRSDGPSLTHRPVDR